MYLNNYIENRVCYKWNEKQKKLTLDNSEIKPRPLDNDTKEFSILTNSVQDA